MFTRILLPQDGSEVSEGIIPFVRMLAKGRPVKVTILYVAGRDGGGDVGTLVRLPEGKAIKTEGYLADLQRDLASDECAVDSVVLTGRPDEEIVRYGEAEGFDLIAMSTHGRSGVGRWVFGSTTDKVMQSTSLPLFIVRSSKVQEKVGPDVAFRSIVVPLDGSLLGECVVADAIDLTKALDLEVRLLRVIPTSTMAMAGADPYAYDPQLYTKIAQGAEDYINRKRAEIEGAGCRASAQAIQGYPPERIITLAEESPDSFIIMSTHGRTGVGRWVLGSVTDRVLRASPRPVLLIHPPETGDGNGV
ncbi:MAG: universal stress protein [Chloroflexi bacterium]|nr:universal stress protein [Chloroflexota bacterium]